MHLIEIQNSLLNERSKHMHPHKNGACVQNCTAADGHSDSVTSWCLHVFTIAETSSGNVTISACHSQLHPHHEQLDKPYIGL